MRHVMARDRRLMWGRRLQRRLTVLWALFSLVIPIKADAQGLMRLSQPEQYQSLVAGPLVLRGAAPSPAIAEAFAHYQQAEFEKALEQIDRVIEEMRGVDRTRQAVATDFRGLIYQRQGKLGFAIDSHTIAIELLERKGAFGLEPRLNAMNNLAIAYYFRGDYQKAEALLTPIIEEPSVNPQTRARARNNRGLINEELGRLDKAIADFVHADFEAGTDKILRAQVLNNQARIWGAQGRLDDAVKKLEEARKLAQEAKDQVLEANLLDSWGEILLKADQPEAALQKLEEARTLEEKVQAPLIKVSIAWNRGRALAKLGRTSEAFAAYEEAVKLAKDSRLAALHREALASRGNLYVQAGKLGEAIADYKKAVEITEKTRDRLRAQTEQDFIKATQRLYQALVEALIKRGNPQDLNEALVYLDRSKSAALHQLLVNLSPELLDKDAERQLRGAKGLLNQEAALAKQLQEALAAVVPEKVMKSLQEQLEKVRKELSVAVAELIERYGGLYDAYVTISPLTFRDLKDQLSAGHLLVEFFPAEDALYFFLVSKEAGVEFRQNRKVRKQELDQMILRYRELMTKVRGSRSAWRIESWADPQWKDLRNLTTRLDEALLQPIADRLAQAEHVIFAPTGLLYYLPLHAVGPFDDKTGELRFLILQKPVSYLSNATLLKVVLGPSKLPQRSLLALANPPFQHEGLGPLKHAEEEITAVKEIFGEQAVILPGPKATKQALLAWLGAPEAQPGGELIVQRGSGSFGFVHLATHGILDPRSPENSWLALDGTNKLVVREIPKLDLRGVSLVTLSACETALAEEQPGRELMSLATFFSQAGASSIMASLWAVDDLATRDLMVGFYEAIVTKEMLDKAKALQQAQVALATKPETRHPFFWAPFILIGDWR